MGNSVILKMAVCCNKDNNIEMKDIYIAKNIAENNQYIIDQYNSHIINNKETQHKIEKMVQTKSKHSSGSGTLIKTKHIYMGENSSSNNNGNASICNNTFQMNNTNIFKNNLMQNNLNNYSKINPIDELRHINSLINFNKYNNSLKDKSFEIKTKLLLSGDLFSNDIIEINKYGMKSGLREKHDGLTIFGLKENNDILNSHSCDYYFSDIEKIDENENENKNKNDNETDNKNDRDINDSSRLEELNRELDKIIASGDNKSQWYNTGSDINWNLEEIISWLLDNSEISTTDITWTTLTTWSDVVDVEQPYEQETQDITQSSNTTDTQNTSTTQTNNNQSNDNTSSQQKRWDCGEWLTVQDCEQMKRDFWNYN